MGVSFVSIFLVGGVAVVFVAAILYILYVLFAKGR